MLHGTVRLFPDVIIYRQIVSLCRRERADFLRFRSQKDLRLFPRTAPHDQPGLHAVPQSGLPDEQAHCGLPGGRRDFGERIYLIASFYLWGG